MYLTSICPYLVMTIPVLLMINASPPATIGTLLPSPVLDAPCARVSSSSQAQMAATPTAMPTVSAELALECLNSVPLNKTAAIQLVESIKPYLEWQSALQLDSAWLKDPPIGYDFPAHDIFSSLDSVKDKLSHDQYNNEYEFQRDLFFVFLPAHNGHLVFYPDGLTKAFEFRRQRALVSVSEDGKSLPVIKLFQDVVINRENASVVTHINGVDAATYVSDFTNIATPLQDKDAAYNSMFFSKASIALRGGNGFFSSGGRTRFIYPGSTTNFTFSNGTHLTTENTARVTGNFTLVDSGPSFYKQFCNPVNITMPEENSNKTSNRPPFIPGYPPAVIRTNDTAVSGYYMDGDGYEDVAVLSVLSFSASTPEEFQKVVEDFLHDAKRDGKKKLVIDLSFNGGGLVLLGYDLFRQLFPNIVQEGDSRWRAGHTFMAISEVCSNTSVNYDPNSSSELQLYQAESTFNYRQDMNTSSQPFQTFEDKFGPVTVKGDQFTNLMQWNLTDPMLTINSTYGMGMDITGYGSRKNFTQPFAAEDIILVYDGFCASTCTIFSQFMRTQASVKSIAFGGRPVEGPIQGIGGVKGSQVLTGLNIYEYAEIASPNATVAQLATLNQLSALPMQRSSAMAFNVRDAILPNNVNDGVPAQFIRENSDCRLYYTEQMVFDVTAIWKAAADSAFNGKGCAYGELPSRPLASTGAPTTVGSVSGLSHGGGTSGETKYVTIEETPPNQSEIWRAQHEQVMVY